MKSNRSRVLGILFLSALVSAGWQAAHARSVAPSLRPADRAAVKSRPVPVRPRLNQYQERALRDFLAQQTSIIDTLRIGAIQVQFADSLMGGQEGSRRPELHDSLYFANELTHLSQYYEGASRGRTVVEWELCGTLYTMPEAMGYYGDVILQDERVVEMMMEVIGQSDDVVDYSKYHTVMLIHAGAGQETDLLDNSREQLFSVFMDLGDIQAAFPDSMVYGLITNDSLNGEPFVVDNFMIVPEDASQDGQRIGSLGIWTFVTGSRFGLLPLFDNTPEGFVDSRGVGDYCVMSYGLFAGPLSGGGFVPVFPCVFNRLIAGWIDPMIVDADGTYRLHDLNDPAPGDTSCIKIPISETEYFLVVNRVHDTDFDSLFTFGDNDTNFFPDNTDDFEDAEFDFYLTFFTNPFEIRPDPVVGDTSIIYNETGSGVYVWHIDESVIRQTLQTGNLPNDFASRKGVDLEEADGIQDLDTANSFFSFGSHFDSYREGNNEMFTAASQPNSRSNSFAPTGVSITDISDVGAYMTLNFALARPYEDTRTRWSGAARFQPPSVFDFDGSGGLEIVALTDTSGVYVFTNDGAEFADGDSDPSTVVPFIPVPDAVWRGAPAVGDVSGDGNSDIIALAEDGRLLMFQADGSATVVRAGGMAAAPPLLVDVDADPEMEIVIVEHNGTNLSGFVLNVDGSNATLDPALQGMWPATFQGQGIAPMAYGALGTSTANTEGVVFAYTDTLEGVVGLHYVPLIFRESPSSPDGWTHTFNPQSEILAGFASVSSPVVGDLDVDGFDEVAFTLHNGSLVTYDPGTNSREMAPLRAANPSAPALGDMDGNGTLEIALWDDTHMYIFENNAQLRTNWPKPFIPTALGSFPPLTFERRLNSPLIGDPDGTGRIKVLFPATEGTVFGFDGAGGAANGFPRSIPSGAEATPTMVDLDGTGELSLISLGYAALLKTIEAVNDTIEATEQMILSIQSLPGSSAQDQQFWTQYQNSLARNGLVTESNPLKTASNVAESGTFIVYPNPVRGEEVHARLILNKSATVKVEVFNLEGQRAVSKTFSVNPGNLIATPFDEAINIADLSAGIYMMRLKIDGNGGSESLVTTFAILR